MEADKNEDSQSQSPPSPPSSAKPPHPSPKCTTSEIGTPRTTPKTSEGNAPEARAHAQTQPLQPKAPIIKIQAAECKSVDEDSDRIHTNFKIDNSLDFDFDLAYRRNRPATGNKLFKRVSFAGTHQHKKSTAMSEETPQRTSSRNSTRSLGDRITSILSVGSRPSTPTFQRQEPPKMTSHSLLYDPNRDPMPDSKEQLEIRLNYHLGELDRLKRQIKALNDAIREQIIHHNFTVQRYGKYMPKSMEELWEMVEFTRRVRDGHGSFVAYHRAELERIAEKRVELDLAMGIEPVLPEVLKKLSNDFEWQQMFLA